MTYFGEDASCLEWHSYSSAAARNSESRMTHFVETAVIEQNGLHISQSIGYFEPIGKELAFL
jgi:hypothetical protein